MSLTSTRRLVTVALAGVVLAACSLAQLSAGYRDDAGVVPPDRDGGPDTSADAGARCDPRAPFGQPVPVTGLSEGVGSFALTADESRAYYASYEGLFFFATPSSLTAMGPGVAVSLGSDGGSIGSATITEDMKTVFFESEYRLWRATGAPGGPYGGAARVNDQGRPFGQPFLDEAHGALWASYYADAGFYRQLVKATFVKGELGPFLDVNLGPGSTHSAVAVADSQSLLFSSNREGQLVGDDIFHVTDLNGDASIVRVAPVNSASLDVPRWLSKDQCLLYLSSARRTGFGQELYLARRGP